MKAVGNEDIRSLAIYHPKLAYAKIVGVPIVPFVDDILIQFSSSTVNAPPVEGNFDNNLTQDTYVQRVSFNLSQQNTFPGSPFQSLYFNQLKQSGATGVGVQVDVFGGPKYTVTGDDYVDLGNFVDVFAITWPHGWLLPKQSNVKVSAVLTQTPVSVPYDVLISFMGAQILDKTLEDLSDQECRARLRKLGLESPDLAILLRP
jgi:hypothetical protein